MTFVLQHVEPRDQIKPAWQFKSKHFPHEYTSRWRSWQDWSLEVEGPWGYSRTGAERKKDCQDLASHVCQFPVGALCSSALSLQWKQWEDLDTAEKGWLLLNWSRLHKGVFALQRNSFSTQCCYTQTLLSFSVAGLVVWHYVRVNAFYSTVPILYII